MPGRRSSVARRTLHHLHQGELRVYPPVLPAAEVAVGEGKSLGHSRPHLPYGRHEQGHPDLQGRRVGGVPGRR